MLEILAVSIVASVISHLVIKLLDNLIAKLINKLHKWDTKKPPVLLPKAGGFFMLKILVMYILYSMLCNL